ncbi:DNA cytosine methyltransferase [Glycomyces sp. NPDC048151]|uniref:DNA cytosine methyltransferase n=1 Tax=Glycomyces sp. NPDC048151 TaxID=3364002 RepID=UPI00372089B5
MRIGSMCSGYGGMDLAVQAVLGGAPAWHAETDRDASAVLAAHWPGVPNVGDLTRCDWSRVEPVDLVAAGFPCQPVSLAGRRLGEADERWIWPDIAAALGVLRPGLVFLENVAAITRSGMGAVAGDLAALGYDTEWTVLAASGLGAPHRRERWFLLAWDRQRAGDIAEHVGRWRAAAHAARVAERAAGLPPHPLAGGRHPRAESRGRGRLAAADAPGLGHGDGRAQAGPGLAAPALGGAPTDAPGIGCEEGECEPVAGQPQGLHPAQRHHPDWGRYRAAIERWEHVTGRAAPAPAALSAGGLPQLRPEFVEWMMDAPPAHVTGLGLGRVAALRLLGNGVVVRQAAAAMHALLGRAGLLRSEGDPLLAELLESRH